MTHFKDEANRSIKDLPSVFPTKVMKSKQVFTSDSMKAVSISSSMLPKVMKSNGGHQG